MLKKYDQKYTIGEKEDDSPKKNFVYGISGNENGKMRGKRTDCGTFDYSYNEIVAGLKKRDIDKKYLKKMNTSKIPYEIPKIYSLNSTKKLLAIAETRTEKLYKVICREDSVSIAIDVKNIGGDINEAILKSKGVYAGKSR